MRLSGRYRHREENDGEESKHQRIHRRLGVDRL